MAFWIYKCNSRGHRNQVVHGDWNEFFAGGGTGEWGSTEWVPGLANAKQGDVVLAYQTNRNELVGVTRVAELRPRGRHLDLILAPIEELRAKVRPLKQGSPAIARIPALQPGPIRTLYSISRSEARFLLHAAKAQYCIDPQDAMMAAEKTMKGGGFGSAVQNRKVKKPP